MPPKNREPVPEGQPLLPGFEPPEPKKVTWSSGPTSSLKREEEDKEGEGECNCNCTGCREGTYHCRKGACKL